MSVLKSSRVKVKKVNNGPLLTTLLNRIKSVERDQKKLVEQYNFIEKELSSVFSMQIDIYNIVIAIRGKVATVPLPMIDLSPMEQSRYADYAKELNELRLIIRTIDQMFYDKFKNKNGTT